MQIARYTHSKGVGYGAFALNRILLRHAHVEVLFLGTGCLAADVHADFDPSVRARVAVVPRYHRQQLPLLLDECDCTVFPTLAEGFGLGLLEAMACGLAPVTTASGGPLDIVTDEVDGLIVPLRDAGAIELALERLIGDPELLARLRRGAHKRAQDFEWGRVARERLNLYETFLKAKVSISCRSPVARRPGLRARGHR